MDLRIKTKVDEMKVTRFRRRT